MPKNEKIIILTGDQLDGGWWNFFCYQEIFVEAAVKTGQEMGVPVEISKCGTTYRFDYERSDLRFPKEWILPRGYFGVLVRTGSPEQRYNFMVRARRVEKEIRESRRK